MAWDCGFILVMNYLYGSWKIIFFVLLMQTVRTWCDDDNNDLKFSMSFMDDGGCDSLFNLFILLTQRRLITFRWIY